MPITKPRNTKNYAKRRKRNSRNKKYFSTYLKNSSKKTNKSFISELIAELPNKEFKSEIDSFLVQNRIRKAISLNNISYITRKSSRIEVKINALKEPNKQLILEYDCHWYDMQDGKALIKMLNKEKNIITKRLFDLEILEQNNISPGDNFKLQMYKIGRAYKPEFNKITRCENEIAEEELNLLDKRINSN